MACMDIHKITPKESKAKRAGLITLISALLVPTISACSASSHAKAHPPTPPAAAAAVDTPASLGAVLGCPAAAGFSEADHGYAGVTQYNCTANGKSPEDPQEVESHFVFATSRGALDTFRRDTASGSNGPFKVV